MARCKIWNEIIIMMPIWLQYVPKIMHTSHDLFVQLCWFILTYRTSSGIRFQVSLACHAHGVTKCLKPCQLQLAVFVCKDDRIPYKNICNGLLVGSDRANIATANSKSHPYTWIAISRGMYRNIRLCHYIMTIHIKPTARTSYLNSITIHWRQCIPLSITDLQLHIQEHGHINGVKTSCIATERNSAMPVMGLWNILSMWEACSQWMRRKWERSIIVDSRVTKESKPV